MQFISLLELNLQIKRALSSHLSPSYWVVAEISELRIVPRGHCYLELIEKEGNHVQAKLKATIWATAFRNINGWFQSVTGENLKPGMKILANIKVDFHELFGLSANILDIDPKFTLGERARRKQEIINKLHAEGLMDLNKLHEIPMVPQRIAIISSSTAAGYEDFLNQLEHNEYSYQFSTSLFEAVMQGRDASPTIIQALYRIFDTVDDFDVVAIIRGGGAQVDMDCFNDYDLAAHIAQFPIPVFTGIGHERDESVADLVAHTKFKTPTAVSAFLVSMLFSYEQKIEGLTTRACGLSQSYLYEKHFQLEAVARDLSHLKARYWSDQVSRLEQIALKIRVYAKQKLVGQQLQLGRIEENVSGICRNYFRAEKQKLDYITNTLKLSDPEQILRKGYTISYINNKLVKDSEVNINDKMITRTSKGTIESTIINKAQIEHGEKEI